MPTNTGSATVNAAAANTTENTNVWNKTFWVFQFLGSAMFLMAGYAKLIGNPQMVHMFETIGLGQGLRYLTGGIEFLSAILLLNPVYAGVAATALAATMVGAVLTHVFIIGGSPSLPIALLALMAVVAYGRKEGVRAFVDKVKERIQKR